MKEKPHPLHALTCCVAIACERLAWYALLAALVSWLPRLGYTDAQAAMAAGYVVMAAYALPLLGAQLADRVLGYRVAALLGACAFAAGYGLLSVERVGLGANLWRFAHQWPLLYGVAAVVLAALAGWLGSLIFRRN